MICIRYLSAHGMLKTVLESNLSDLLFARKVEWSAIPVDSGVAFVFCRLRQRKEVQSVVIPVIPTKKLTKENIINENKSYFRFFIRRIEKGNS